VQLFSVMTVSAALFQFRKSEIFSHSEFWFQSSNQSGTVNPLALCWAPLTSWQWYMGVNTHLWKSMWKIRV